MIERREGVVRRRMLGADLQRIVEPAKRLLRPPGPHGDQGHFVVRRRVVEGLLEPTLEEVLDPVYVGLDPTDRLLLLGRLDLLAVLVRAKENW